MREQLIEEMTVGQLATDAAGIDLLMEIEKRYPDASAGEIESSVCNAAQELDPLKSDFVVS